jgi:hypothetical protein
MIDELKENDNVDSGEAAAAALAMRPPSRPVPPVRLVTGLGAMMGNLDCQG